MIIVLFGAPGVGKGTQAAILAEKLNIAHLSTGDAFRAAIKNATPVGVLAKSYVDAGALVPDDVVARIVEETMEAPSFSNGCILDGFPRTRAQADALQQLLAAKGLAVTCVVNLNVDDETIINRLLARGREDDKEDIIRYRLDVYNKETAPLLEFYEGAGLLTSVDGLGTVEDVNKRILAAIAVRQSQPH